MKNKMFTTSLIALFIITLFINITSPYISKYLNTVIWMIVIVGLISTGLYFTINLKFLQFHFIKIIKSLIPKKRNNKDISAFESLSLTLASKIGVGSISGVALAIYIGGIGTLFWIWLSNLIISINTYVESYYGNYYHGGPNIYIKKRLGNSALSSFYAILIIISFIIGFLSIQANTIVKTINISYNINTIIIDLILIIITSLVIFKSIKKIAKFTSYLVPIMTIIYIIIGLIITIKNITIIPSIFIHIFTSAFNTKSVTTSVIYTIIIGIQRGVFATESGIGTSAIAASLTKENPHVSGLSQLFGIHFISLIITTITGLLVILSDYQTLNLTNINGIELITNSFIYNFGNYGKLLLNITIILFAFSTIISGYYYGEDSLKFLLKNKYTNKTIIYFKIISIIILFIGGLINSSIIWNYIDIFIAFLAITNIYAITSIYKKNNKK